MTAKRLNVKKVIATQQRGHSSLSCPSGSPLLILDPLQLLQPEALHHEGLVAPHGDGGQAARRGASSRGRAPRISLLLRTKTPRGGHRQSGLLTQGPWFGRCKEKDSLEGLSQQRMMGHGGAR